MPISFRKHGIILLILAVCVLCVTPVLAWDEYTESEYTHTHDFIEIFAPNHTTVIDRDYYLTKHIDIDFVNDYIEFQKSLIMNNPNLRVVLNIPGHGWFNNNEVIAEAYMNRNIYQNYEGDTLVSSAIDADGKTLSYYTHTDLIDSLKYEMKVNDFKWIDVQRCIEKLPEGPRVFVNTIYGQNYKP